MKNNPITVSDINLAAALAAIGIPLFQHEDNSEPWVKLQTKRGNSFSFFFETENDLGDITQDYVDHWFDDDYIDRNPDCPFAMIKATFENRASLLDIINQSKSLIVVEKGKRFALISSDASDEQKDEIFRKL